MNQTQKIVILIGLIVMVGMVVYPPWTSVDEEGKASSMGYGFLWQPPEVNNEARGNIFGIKINIQLKSTRANSLDYGRLLMQEGVAALVIGGIFALAGKTKS
jgi:hypothetical protein